MPIWKLHFCSVLPGCRESLHAICYLERFESYGSSSIRSDKGLALETSASESLYGGQFTLSTQLIKRNYLVILPYPLYSSE